MHFTESSNHSSPEENSYEELEIPSVSIALSIRSGPEQPVRTFSPFELKACGTRILKLGSFQRETQFS